MKLQPVSVWTRPHSHNGELRAGVDQRSEMPCLWRAPMLVTLLFIVFVGLCITPVFAQEMGRTTWQHPAEREDHPFPIPVPGIGKGGVPAMSGATPGPDFLTECECYVVGPTRAKTKTAPGLIPDLGHCPIIICF